MYASNVCIKDAYVNPLFTKCILPCFLDRFQGGRSIRREEDAICEPAAHLLLLAKEVACILTKMSLHACFTPGDGGERNAVSLVVSGSKSQEGVQGLAVGVCRLRPVFSPAARHRIDHKRADLRNEQIEPS